MQTKLHRVGAEGKRKRKGTAGIVYIEFLTVGGSTPSQLSSESTWRKYSHFLCEEILLSIIPKVIAVK